MMTHVLAIRSLHHSGVISEVALLPEDASIPVAPTLSTILELPHSRDFSSTQDSFNKNIIPGILLQLHHSNRSFMILAFNYVTWSSFTFITWNALKFVQLLLRFVQTNSPTFARHGDGLGYIRIWAISSRRLVFWNSAPSPYKWYQGHVSNLAMYERSPRAQKARAQQKAWWAPIKLDLKRIELSRRLWCSRCFT